MNFCGLRPGTLRAKLTLSSLAMLAAGIVVATCISLMGIKHYLVSAVDAELMHSRNGLAQTRLTTGQIAAISSAAAQHNELVIRDLMSAGGSRTSFALLGKDGEAAQFAGQTPDDRQRALAHAATAAGPGAMLRGKEPRDLTVDGRLYRATALRLGDGNVLVLATEAAGVGKVMNKVVRLELLAGIVLTAGLGTATFFGSRRRLRPLEDMVETASAIAEGSAEGGDGSGASGLVLSRRVAAPPSKHTVGEVEQLRVALNAMLHQVEAAFLTREHAAAQLRRFVADASHELRTPLAAIRGYLQLYERGMLGEQAQRERALARMIAESERMGRLVDELLALARLDQRPELRPRPVDLARLAQEALDDLAAQQPGRPVEFTGRDGCSVMADESVLRQVVGNLVANVRVHTPQDVPVAVAVRREEDHGVLRVADEGPGMHPEDAERVFDRFFRADGGGGSGLGMSVVRAGVEALGGTVRVITAPGAGLSVTVTLPVDAAPSGKGAAPSGKGAAPSDGASSGTGQACLEASSTTVMSESAPTRTGGPQAPAPRVT